MKIVYEFVRDGIEADVKVTEDKHTGSVRVTVEPYFYNPIATVPVVSAATITDKGRTIQQELHVVSGHSGKVKRLQSGKKVKPLCDKDGKKEATEEETE